MSAPGGSPTGASAAIPSASGRRYSCCSADSPAAARGEFKQGRHRARAEAAREFLRQVFLLRVVDDVLGLDHFPRHVVEPAQAVGETELNALRAAPDQAREHVRRLLEPLAAAFLHG